MGDIASLVPRASSWPALPMDDRSGMFGLGTMPMRLNTTFNNEREEIVGDFTGLALGAFQQNATVFAVEMKRLQLFSQVVFKFRRERDGALFGNTDLRILEHPEIGETTQDLLLKTLLYADIGGDVCIVRRPNRLKVLRPDWTVTISGSPNRNADPNDLDMELIGIVYQEGGLYSSNDPIFIQRGEFAQYIPVKHPLAQNRGLPWFVPALRTIMGDTAATAHKLQFFEHAATPNMVVTLDPAITIENARKWIELFEQEHAGVWNAYKTAYFGGGATATGVGKDFQQMDFKVVQGAGQTLIAAAGSIHPTVAGLSEGLQGSSLNAGNFKEAAQLVGDTFLRPEWAKLAGSLEVIVPPPADARLWYDESRVSFLKEDVKDAAEVMKSKATAVRTLTDGGYKPETVIATVWPDSSLVHAGYLPVQVQPIQANAAAESDPTNQPAALLPAGPTPRFPIPQLAAGEFRCPNNRADGTPCNALLMKAGRPAPGSKMDCWRCKAEVTAA